jgi:hypothetical protein
MTKVAYCLVVHKNPKQVNRLIRNIYSASDFFYISIFGKNSKKNEWINEFKEFESDNFFVIFYLRNAWGAFPVVQSTLEAMKAFSGFNYDYFINLTGQCYPLKSVGSIKKFLHDKNFAYMEQFKLPSKRWGKRGGLDRFEYLHYRNPLFVLRDILLNKIAGSAEYETKRFIKLPRRNRQLPYNLEPYGGSAYFCLTKEHVDFILRYLKSKPDVLGFFTRTFAPDEIFFQTIIMNSPLKDTVINNNLRYIDWSRKGMPSPALLTIADAENLLNSSKLFARKFDMEIDKAILDLIDSHKKI